MGNFNRKLRKCRKGVSEIIGNILILGITVTLFSSIMVFVVSMPPPQESAYADFTPNVRYLGEPATQIELNLTHKGGQEMKSYTTNIYFMVDDTNHVLHMADSLNPLGDLWTVGETFRYVYTHNGTGDIHQLRLAVMISDTEKNTLLYNANLVGGSADTSSAPIIGARGTTPSPSFVGQSIRFYAQVMDMDNDLDTDQVWVDLSSISLGLQRLTDSNNDGIFTTGTFTADLAWDGKLAILNASDHQGHQTYGQMTISILPQAGGGETIYQGPFYNYSHYFINGSYPPDVTGGESGGSSAAGTTFYYIRRALDYSISRDFVPGEDILFELYSDTLANLALENAFFIYHPITGNKIYPQTQEVNALMYGGIYGTFYRYVYVFDAPSDPYIYPLQVKSKDNLGTVVNIVDTISVSGGSYPKLTTYKNESNLLVQSRGFNHTDTVYLKISSLNVDAFSSGVYVSDIEISDYTGRYVVKKVPPAYSNPPLAYSTPVSCVHKTGNSPSPNYEGSGAGEYTIRINLQDAYQGWWLPRTNWYTLRIGLFTDSNEVYNQLSVQINVTAPLTTMDILASVGSGSFTWSSSGASWDDSAVKWYTFTEEWDETVIATSIDGTLPSDGPIGLCLADLDGDGDMDCVVGTQDQTQPNILWYENYQVDGSDWSDPRAVCLPFDAMAGLQSANTDDAGNANEDVSVYKTAGTDRFYGDEGDVCRNELCADLEVGDFDGDGDGDIVASFVHVVVYTTTASRGAAEYENCWGMYFNRGIYVFWNDGSWTKKVLYGTMDWVAGNAANRNSNPAAMDLDVADFNLDGYDDIVAVYENGETKVWMNLWGVIKGSIAVHQDKAFGSDGASYTVRTIPAYAGTGTAPWNLVQYPVRVAADRVNNDNYPDIVRTNTNDKSITVYYTLPSVGDVVFANATQEWAFGSNCSHTGSLANLVASDASYESFTEAYLDYEPINATAAAKGIMDDTGEDLDKLAADDGDPYKVDKSKQMYITMWDIPAAYTGKIVSQAVIKTKFTVESGYTMNSPLEWALSGGAFSSTAIIPANGDTNVLAQFTLPDYVDTYDDVRGLDIRFINADALRYVQFEYLIIEVTFVETREMGWVWKVPNVDRAYHNLTVELTRMGPSIEAFRLAYSVDNTTWFNLTDLAGAIGSEVSYTFDLTYTPSDYYYIRILDLDRSTGDVINDTIQVDRLYIKHWMQNVDWSTSSPSYYYRYQFSLGGGSDPKVQNYYQITGIAVGDMGKTWDDYALDGLQDIVVCTSKVSVGGTYEALYVMCQQDPDTFDVKPVITSSLNTNCPVSGSWGSGSYIDYDCKDVELGDYDGDSDLDIVLVVGARFGTNPGTGASLWLYENEQRYLPGGAQWQYDEDYLNLLVTKGDSAINVQTGNIDLAILLPFLGIMGVIVAEAVIDRRRRR